MSREWHLKRDHKFRKKLADKIKAIAVKRKKKRAS
jgi:hypothetical protein